MQQFAEDQKLVKRRNSIISFTDINEEAKEAKCPRIHPAGEMDPWFDKDGFVTFGDHVMEEEEIRQARLEWRAQFKSVEYCVH